MSTKKENPTVKILDRIKKLLALAQGKGGTANEVAVAAALAAQLMQAHKLTEADIPTDETDGSDMVDLPAGADFLDSWKFVLVTCVARSFMCEAVGLRAAGRRKVRVVGRREDVEVTLEVYGHLVGEVERLTTAYEGDEIEWGDMWNRMFGEIDRRTEIFPERRDAYRDGLVAGIATKLREQKVKFEETSEKALVVSRKSREEIRGYITTKFADPRKVDREAPQAESVEELDFVRGFIRGQQVVVPTQSKPAGVPLPAVDEPSKSEGDKS